MCPSGVEGRADAAAQASGSSEQSRKDAALQEGKAAAWTQLLCHSAVCTSHHCVLKERCQASKTALVHALVCPGVLCDESTCPWARRLLLHRLSGLEDRGMAPPLQPKPLQELVPSLLSASLLEQQAAADPHAVASPDSWGSGIASFVPQEGKAQPSTASLTTTAARSSMDQWLTNDTMAWASSLPNPLPSTPMQEANPAIMLFGQWLVHSLISNVLPVPSPAEDSAAAASSSSAPSAATASEDPEAEAADKLSGRDMWIHMLICADCSSQAPTDAPSPAEQAAEPAVCRDRICQFAKRFLYHRLTCEMLSECALCQSVCQAFGSGLLQDGDSNQDTAVEDLRARLESLNAA